MWPDLVVIDAPVLNDLSRIGQIEKQIAATSPMSGQKRW